MIHERKKEVKTGKDNLKIIRQVRIKRSNKSLIDNKPLP